MAALQYSSNQGLTPTTARPDVTIIVVPRERFQFAQESLESLYKSTSFPFELIYVDNNSPTRLRQYLAGQAQAKGFRVVRSDRYLSPNAARNFGLQHVTSRYVVFVDNDVIFAPGWLGALVNCTKETGATVVGSLVCQYRPVHQTIHCAGGEYMAADDRERFMRGEPLGSEPGGWHIYEKTYFQNRSVEEVKDQLYRTLTGFVEFHAMLVQMDFLRQHGPLDEGFCCTKEYLDFAMTVSRAGGSIYLEPASVVTFLTHPPAPRLRWVDLPHFSLRWSDAWERASLEHFQKKWHLANSKYFQKRYKKLGWRRWEELIKPRIDGLAWLGQPRAKRLEKILVAWEKRLNQGWCDRYIQQQAKQLGCDPAVVADGQNYPAIALAPAIADSASPTMVSDRPRGAIAEPEAVALHP